MSKDSRIISILIALEAIILVVMALSASAKVSKLPEESSGKIPEPTKTDIIAVNTDFPVNSTDIPTFYPEKTPGKTQKPERTQPPVQMYNYYTFNFTKDGVTVNVSEGTAGQNMQGMVTDLKSSDLTIKKSKSTFKLGEYEIDNYYVPEDISLMDIFSEPLVLKKIGFTENSCDIIIYHTHTSEAYCMTEEDKSKIKGYGTSKVPEETVVSCARIISSKINESDSGIICINDETVHDQGTDSLIAYELSANTLRGLLEKNPKAQLAIDIHRDSVDPVNGKRWGPTARKSDDKYAQISFVVGLDYDNGSRNISNNPNWKENFKLATLISQKMDNLVPGITRCISLRKTAYNQNIANNSLLIEIGFDGNLISESNATAELLAKVLEEIYT